MEVTTAFENALAKLITKYLTKIDSTKLAATMELQINALREKNGVYLRVAYLSQQTNR